MRNHRLAKGQGQVEYALLLSLVAVLLILLLATVGKAPRQMLSDVLCMVKYKSGSAHAVDSPQPGGSTLVISPGSHTPVHSITWGEFKTTYTWQNDDKFVCIDGLIADNGNLTSYIVYEGN